MENATDRSQSVIVDSYVEYYSRVVDFITYRINNRCEAEDLAQDVFVKRVIFLISPFFAGKRQNPLWIILIVKICFPELPVKNLG